MKQWYFYDESGRVYLTYMAQPSNQILRSGNYIIAGKPADKDGYDTILSVDLKTKELKVSYKEITNQGGECVAKDGKNGLSTYQIAQQNGFTGNEKQWLDSLKGKDGISQTVSNIKLSNVELDDTGINALNNKIAYGHNHKGNQVVLGQKDWANKKYILEDIIDFLGEENKLLKARIDELEKKITKK